MAWIIKPLEIAKDGVGTGRFRMTATSDEGGGDPIGDESHDHASAEEAQSCNICDEYCSRITGFNSIKRRQEIEDQYEREEFERIKAKLEPVH